MVKKNQKTDTCIAQEVEHRVNVAKIRMHPTGLVDVEMLSNLLGGNADADEERRSHSEAGSRSLRLLARQSASPGFCLLRTSTSRRCALAAAAATSGMTRDAQPPKPQHWKGTPHERLTPSQ